MRPRPGVVRGIRGDVRRPVLGACFVRSLERRRALVDAGPPFGNASGAVGVGERRDAVRAHAPGEAQSLRSLSLQLSGTWSVPAVGKQVAARALRRLDLSA